LKEVEEMGTLNVFKPRKDAEMFVQNSARSAEEDRE
jgi:hypothetical protein